MLESLNLDSTRYGDLFDAALEKIPRRAPGWTDLRPHDPGVTVLETMALLADMQNYYCNQVSGAHRRAYLRLLGLPPAPLGPARALATPREPVLHPVRIPAGALFDALGIPFETEREHLLFPGKIDAVFLEQPGGAQNLFPLLHRAADPGATVFDRPDQTLLLGFTDPLPAGVPVALAICAVSRCNPPSEEEASPPLLTLHWEALCAGGWREAGAADETHGLMQSGFLTLTLPAPMQKTGFNGGPARFYLRARAERPADPAPLLQSIHLNALPLVQRETLAESAVLRGPGPHRVNTRLFREGASLLFRRRGADLWERLPAPATPCADGRPFRLAGDAEYRLVSLDARVARPADLSGVTSQSFHLDLPGVDPGSLSLMLRQGGESPLYRDAVRRDEPAAGETLPCGYRYDAAEQTVRLGDGRDFLIPARAREGLVFTSLALCAGEDGNAAAHSIRARDPLLQPLAFDNDAPAEGGKNPEDAAALFSRARALLGAPARAATAADCRRLALETPGLALHKAAAFPLRADAGHKGGGFAVVVKPASDREPLPALSARARAQIRAHLEQYRLLTGHIEVLEPRYLPVTARVSLCPTEEGRAMREEIRALLFRRLDGVRGGCSFGGVISYAALYSDLNALPYVRWLKELTLIPGGGARGNAAPLCRRAPNRDIRLAPDVLPWLANCEILFQD